MEQRYTPEARPREPIKPLRIRDEEPGGLLGILVWWRKRGGVFWWTMVLVALSVVTTLVVAVPAARTMGHLDFRPPPDMIVIAEADKATVSPGDTIVFTVAYENIGGSEAGAVIIDIDLPDELTAVSVQPGSPACSQAGQLERFSSEKLGEITGEPGGTMKCLFGTRREGSRGEIILEAAVGDVPSDADIGIEVWLSTDQTDNVAKEEEIWDNNCTALKIAAGTEGRSGQAAMARDIDCTPLAFVARSLQAEADKPSVSTGDMLTLAIGHENIGGSEAGTVAIDIELPNELTAVKLQQLLDEKVWDGDPTCSHPNRLDQVPREGQAQIAGEPGGTVECLVGSRSDGAQMEILLDASVGEVTSGDTINVDICVRPEQAAAVASQGGLEDNICTPLAVPVR